MEEDELGGEMTSHGVRSSSEVLEGEIVGKRPFWRPKISLNNFLSVFIQRCCQLRVIYVRSCVKPLNTELIPICHPLALLGTRHILHVSRIKLDV